jgi:hypothetical protein
MLSQYDNNQFFLSGWVSKGHPVAKDPADVKIPATFLPGVWLHVVG